MLLRRHKHCKRKAPQSVNTVRVLKQAVGVLKRRAETGYYRILIGYQVLENEELAAAQPAAAR